MTYPLFCRLEPTKDELIVWMKPDVKATLQDLPVGDYLHREAQLLGFNAFHAFAEDRWGVDGHWRWLTKPSLDELVGTAGAWVSVMKGQQFDYRASHAFCVSLSELMITLGCCTQMEEAPDDCHLRQLFVTQYVGRGLGTGGSGLGGFITMHGRRVLQEIRAADIEDDLCRIVAKTMQATYQLVAPGFSLGEDSTFFRLNVNQGGKFYLTAPGNACDIGVDGMEHTDEPYGFEIGCHNLDNPLQQQSLLAGLAAMEHFMWQFMMETATS